jgi:SAM-dependent methyltransferase
MLMARHRDADRRPGPNEMHDRTRMMTNAYSSQWFQLFMPSTEAASTWSDLAFLARQLPLPSYRRVLDICCGYGRHAIGLSAQGYRVTGLDRDAAAIAEARRGAEAAGVDVTFVTEDMREVGALQGPFDAAINMWQSLSYFDEETNAGVLRAIHDQLTAGGRFVVDLYNRESLERQQGTRQQEIKGVIVESNGFMQGNRWHSELTYRDADGAVTGRDHMEWQVYTPNEFGSLANACGFTTQLVCAWWDENLPPAADIGRMQVVLMRE